jgi:carbon storage regulator
MSESEGKLVLSRAPRQRVRIGVDIIIEVVEIRGGRVRLGITAPKDVSVHREEVFERIKRGEPKP